MENQKLSELEDMRNMRRSKTLVTKHNLIPFDTAIVNTRRFSGEVHKIIEIKNNVEKRK